MSSHRNGTPYFAYTQAIDPTELLQAVSISRNGTERNGTERNVGLNYGTDRSILIIRTDARPTDSGTTPSRTQAQFPRIVAYMYYMY